MNKNFNTLSIISTVVLLLLLTSCSNYKKPLPDSGVTVKDVTSESYETLKVSYQELKTAFFSERKK